jgi:hypothetical protein
MKSWITNSEELLGVSEKQAENFSRNGTILSDRKPQPCGKRQDIHKGDEISTSKLREQVAEAIRKERD